MLDKLCEKDLLIMVSKGNRTAFYKIFERYKDKIYSFAIYLTRTDYMAEEITQDVFIKIWTTKERLPYVDSFNSYIMVIARNTASNYLKRQAFEQILLNKLAVKISSEQQWGEEIIDEDIILKIHEEAISKLPPQQRKVYTLHHIKKIKIKILQTPSAFQFIQ